MSYVDNSMAKDEVLVYRAKTHWMAIAAPVPLLVAALLLLNGGKLVGIIVAIFLAIYSLAGVIAFFTTELAVTSKKVVGKWGFVSREMIEQRLDKVDSVSVTQSILGRLFDYGTVIVNGSGKSTSPARFIAEPLVYRRSVQEAIEKAGAN